MAPPFDSDLAALTLEELQAFLDAELEEGLTWEAKGPREIRPPQVRKAISGFANAIGGSLVIGAERQGDAWRLPGIAFPGVEAKTWLSSVIRDLAPPPRHTIKVLPTADEGMVVAVVAVEPIDVPPCMSGGSVYERVSGQTVPVTDPAVLRSLFARGEQARKSAMKRAHAAARAAFWDPLIPHERYRLVAGEEERLPGRKPFGLALAPISWPDTCKADVFRQSFTNELERIARATQRMARSAPAIEQTRSLVQVTMRGWDDYWVVRVHVDGAASVGYGSELVPEYVSPGEAMIRLEDAWKLAADALTAIGATGDAWFALFLASTRRPPGGRWTIAPSPTMDVGGVTPIGHPSEASLARIRRELDREAGHTAFDPEAPSSDGGPT